MEKIDENDGNFNYHPPACTTSFKKNSELKNKFFGIFTETESNLNRNIFYHSYSCTVR